ncbi:hypothetical protein G3G77_004268 [Salmonella enterica]|nr:hypothetical protein [Salmonella enterica]EEH5466121.1 hypothetical protein [Salmonella enterica]EEH7555565.1 hypothetical protein [Salmonella enterica]EEO5639928.1 hypothetical protein [Salmonella enterica]EEQ0203897.1 hypothetical protein [Salmonella enterica]
MADLRQVIFCHTRHFHDGIAVNAVLVHGTGIFSVASRSPFSIPRCSPSLIPFLSAELWCSRSKWMYNPAVKSRMVNDNAALCHYLFLVA